MDDEASRAREALWRLEAGQPGEALEALRDASPIDVLVAYARARALADLARFGDAEQEARRGLELEPENVDLLETLATVQLNSDATFMLRASEASEARNAARQLLREHPDEAFAHYLHGLALLSGRWWRGLWHLRRAAAMSPHEPLLAETARIMGSWYLWPVHMTGGVKHYVFTVAFVAYIVVDGVRNDGMSWRLWAIFSAFIAYKWIAYFVARAVVSRRVTRALRER